MAETIKIPSFDNLNLQEQSVLSADANAGQAIIAPLNLSGYSTNDFILITPNFGSETSEILRVQSVSSTQITFTSNLTFKHYKGEKIYKLFGNQMKLYRAANVNGTIPADGSFSVVGSAAIIEADDIFTELTDSSGGSSYWYKATYYNSVSTNETSLSNAEALRGGGYGHYCSIEDILKEAGLSTNAQIDETQVSARRDQAESEVQGVLAGAGYTLPLTDSSDNAYTPPVIENIVRTLAAGLILSQDYGAAAQGGTNDGAKKAQEARDLLTKISDRTLVLTDPTGAQLAITSRVQSWPDDTTADVGTDGVTGEPAYFTMSKKF